LEGNHWTQEHRVFQQSWTPQQQAAGNVGAVRESHGHDARAVQPVRLDGPFDESRQFLRAHSEIFLIEDPFTYPPEESQSASLVHLAARAEQRSARKKHPAKRDEVVLVPTGSVQQEQRGAPGQFRLSLWRDVAMDEA